MTRTNVVMHDEDGSWWADSPDLKGFTVVAPTLGASKRGFFGSAIRNLNSTCNDARDVGCTTENPAVVSCLDERFLRCDFGFGACGQSA